MDKKDKYEVLRLFSDLYDSNIVKKLELFLDNCYFKFESQQDLSPKELKGLIQINDFRKIWEKK